MSLSFHNTCWILQYGLKESCFPDCWKVSLVVSAFRNVGERSTAENCRPVSLVFFLWLVKSLKNSNNKIFYHVEKCGLFSDFHYGFRSSESTSDLLTVASDRIARAFSLLVSFKNLSLMEFQVRYLALFLPFSII